MNMTSASDSQARRPEGPKEVSPGLALGTGLPLVCAGLEGREKHSFLRPFRADRLFGNRSPR